MKNLDIFLCTHKDFIPVVSNKSYKIICQNELNITNSNGLEIIRENDVPEVTNEQIAWSECSRIYYVWKKYPVNDYIGFCHYSRIIDINIKDIPNILSNTDIICTNWVGPRTVYDDWNYFHNINDLIELCKIANKKFGVSKNIINKFLNTKSMYHYNMFITKKEIFYNYCNFAFSLINYWKKNNSITNLIDLYNYLLKNKYKYCHNQDVYNSINEQARLYGFMMEFLLQLYIMHKNLKVCVFPIIDLKK